MVERVVADFMQRDVEPGAMARHALRALIAGALYPLGTYHAALREIGFEVYVIGRGQPL